MRFKHFLATAFCAALPLAGFACISGAHAQQGFQYTAPQHIAPRAGGPMASSDVTRQAALEQQLRDLTDQIEQRDYEIRQLKSAFEKYVADTNARLGALEGGGQNALSSAPAVVNEPPMPQPHTAPEVEGGMIDPNGAYQPPKDKSSHLLGTLGSAPQPTPTPNVTAAKPVAANAPQAYDQAFALLQQNNYAGAQQAFARFLDDYPTNPLAANAKYWLGETYFAQAQYGPAAQTFAKAYQDHPKGQKAPDSLLKLALTLEKLDKKSDACVTLSELQKRYKDGPSSVLRRAGDEAGRMQCPTN